MPDDDIIVGSAAVEINATTRGFIADLRAQIEPGVRQLAENLGKVLEDKIAAGIAKGTGQGFTTAEPLAKQKGKQSGEGFGGEFGRQAQARIRAALAALPEAKIGVAKTEAEQKLKDLRAEIASLGDKRIGVDIDAAEAKAKILELQAELAALAARSPDIDVRVNTAAAAAELAAFSAAIDPLLDAGSGLPALGSAGSRAAAGTSSVAASFGATAVAGAGLLAVLSPVLGALGGIIAALGAPLGAATAGGTLYALLAGKAIKDTNKVAKQIDELRKKADTLQDPKAAQAARDQAKALEDSLTGPQKRFLEAKSELSKAFGEFMDGPAGDAVFDPIVSGMELLEKILPKVSPLLVETSDAVSDLLDSLAKKAGGSDEFFESLGKLAGDGIRDGGRTLGNLAGAISSVLEAGSDTGAAAMDSIADGAERLYKYLKSPEGQEQLEEFFTWLEEHGPGIAENIGDLAEYFVNWMISAAPVGEQLLDLAGDAAKFGTAITKVVRPVYRFADAIDAAKAFTFPLRLGLSGIIEAAAGVMTVFGKMLGALARIPGDKFEWAREGAREMDKAAADARGLAKDVRAIPGKKTIFVKAETAEAKRAIKNLIDAAESWVVNLPIVGEKAGGNAKGTNNWRGGWSWVGEEGPELMRLPAGTQIRSNPDSMAMVRASAPAPAAVMAATAGPSLGFDLGQLEPSLHVISAETNLDTGTIEVLVEAHLDNLVDFNDQQDRWE